MRDTARWMRRSPVCSRAVLGIGLALVCSLMALHGGRVTAARAGLGQGGEFTVRLPLAA
jgi:signal transduction histidine kinase